MVLTPVGVVESGIRERKVMPPLGASGTVRLYPEFEAGLDRIEKHSHIWVLGWFDRAERDVLRVTPRGVMDRGPEGLHGVFAVRSPVRPNPIGLTACRVLNIDGLRIEVDRLDFLDGTPVIDLKPYFVTRDSIFAANNAAIGRPAGRDALRLSLLMQAEHFHGELCADLALAVRLLEHYRAETADFTEPGSVTVPLGRPCLIDAMMGMTRTTPGRGTLRFTSEDLVTLGRRRYVLPSDLPARAEAVLAAPEEALIRLG